MWQTILTLIIVVTAVFFAIRPYFKKKSASSHDCNGCSSACGDCPVMEIKDQIETQRKNQSVTARRAD